MKQRRILKKLKLLVIFSMLSTMLAACSTSTTYVTKQDEIIKVTKGQSYIAPDNGWMLSDRAVARIMHTKVVDTNLK